MSRKLFAVIPIAVLAVVTQCPAILINYSVDGWGPYNANPGNGFPGDLIQLGAYSGSLDLLVGIPQTGKINDLLWTVQDSGPFNGTFNFTASRLMTMSAGNENTIQNGLLNVTTTADILSLDGGGTVAFNFGPYSVYVTPLSAGPFVATALGSQTHEVDAQFVLEGTLPVPDGGMTSVLLGISMLAVGWIRRIMK